MKNSFYIKTFGCQQNSADSQRIASFYLSRGFQKSKTIDSATDIVINTCMVRQSAEDRVTGLIKNLVKKIKKNHKKRPQIILTGCMVGMVNREKNGKYLKILKHRLPEVDQFLSLDEVGFNYPPLREDKTHAWIPISNGCNNFCTYCVVPFTRGEEVSRSFKDISGEVKDLAKKGYVEVTLLGQNVNSYGSDLVKSKLKGYKLPSGRIVKPIMVKHLGKKRIPTLFPYILEEVCKIKGIKCVKFISSNPWDFSDKLIEVIANNKKIDRNIHLPIQSGDYQILKKMNRWYTQKEYIDLVKKIRKKIKDTQISTDIIVGFPTETKKQFENTVKLAKAVNFAYAYVAKYSPRPNTAASIAYKDNISYDEKDRRFKILNKLINSKKSPRTAVH
ncbi:hypothetical protein A2164_01510 [Candidatus Curtissbacteria bacterium RBG_13_35_7]|uniref:tRNA-2-methylthio-N(6)-dimethylallyladenosine synthase n=1 Tax=Candidatus Curtissbacteria bacterium RBG_13_35_7 TaxID=1797705 RepID=A0A1F5G1E4_9BACT|nr:MAG: hypothetical protein A2164_01510 [Candidatus Curtissbacteria bacterium RBG_13_35_7]